MKKTLKLGSKTILLKSWNLKELLKSPKLTVRKKLKRSTANRSKRKNLKEPNKKLPPTAHTFQTHRKHKSLIRPSNIPQIKTTHKTDIKSAEFKIMSQDKDRSSSAKRDSNWLGFSLTTMSEKRKTKSANLVDSPLAFSQNELGSLKLSDPSVNSSNQSSKSFLISMSSETILNSRLSPLTKSNQSTNSEISDMSFHSLKRTNSLPRISYPEKKFNFNRSSTNGDSKRSSIHSKKHSAGTLNQISQQLNRLFKLCDEIKFHKKSKSNNILEGLGSISFEIPSADHNRQDMCGQNHFLGTLCTINEELSVELENNKRSSLWSGK